MGPLLLRFSISSSVSFEKFVRKIRLTTFFVTFRFHLCWMSNRPCGVLHVLARLGHLGKTGRPQISHQYIHQEIPHPPKKMSCLFLSDRYQKKCLGVFFGHSQQTFQLIMSKIEGFIYSIYIYFSLWVKKWWTLKLPTIQPSNLFETGVIHWKPCLFFSCRDCCPRTWVARHHWAWEVHRGGGSGEKMKNSKVIRTLKELLRFFEKLKYLDFNYRDIDTLPNLKV